MATTTPPLFRLKSTVRQLVTARQFFREHSDGVVLIDYLRWDRQAFDAWFRRCLFRKINRYLPATAGRKANEEWQLQAARVARMLKGRVVVRPRDCPSELRARLQHRFYEAD